MPDAADRPAYAVLGALGLLMTLGALHEWRPGDRFSTVMALVMLAWTLYAATWAVQALRYRRVPGRAGGFAASGELDDGAAWDVDDDGANRPAAPQAATHGGASEPSRWAARA